MLQTLFSNHVCLKRDSTGDSFQVVAQHFNFANGKCSRNPSVPVVKAGNVGLIQLVLSSLLPLWEPSWGFSFFLQKALSVTRGQDCLFLRDNLVVIQSWSGLVVKHRRHNARGRLFLEHVLSDPWLPPAVEVIVLGDENGSVGLFCVSKPKEREREREGMGV